jgi:hypothetical protein
MIFPTLVTERLENVHKLVARALLEPRFASLEDIRKLFSPVGSPSSRPDARQEVFDVFEFPSNVDNIPALLDMLDQQLSRLFRLDNASTKTDDVFTTFTQKPSEQLRLLCTESWPAVRFDKLGNGLASVLGEYLVGVDVGASKNIGGDATNVRLTCTAHTDDDYRVIVVRRTRCSLGRGLRVIGSIQLDSVDSDTNLTRQQLGHYQYYLAHLVLEIIPEIGPSLLDASLLLNDRLIDDTGEHTESHGHSVIIITMYRGSTAKRGMVLSKDDDPIVKLVGLDTEFS